MALILASFPNSRVKPRPATSARDTSIVDIPANTTKQVIGQNLNRTDLLLKNLDSSIKVWYGYDNSINTNIGANGAFPLEPGDSVSIDVGIPIFVFNPDGASAVNVSLDEGEG